MPEASGSIIRLHDPAYEWVVNLSVVVSALALVAWALAFSRSRRGGRIVD